MSRGTQIEWADDTWNPILGCRRVDEGCEACYAEGIAARLALNPLQPRYKGLAIFGQQGPRWTGQARFVEEVLEQPLSWKAPRRIFPCSMSDLFFEEVPDEWIDRVVDVMRRTPQHTYLVTTKRADRAALYSHKRQLPRNLWLGTSIAGNGAKQLRRVLSILAADVPSGVRWVSYEPALSLVDFTRIPFAEHGPGAYMDALNGCYGVESSWKMTANARLSWVVLGGESGTAKRGPRAPRPMHPDLPRLTRDACVAAGVAFFFKQWGAHHPVGPMSAPQPWACLRGAHGDFTRELLQAHRDDHGPACDPCIMYRVGKKAAGRDLDGRTWDEFPSTSAA